MKERGKFTLKARLFSFLNAFAGIRVLLRDEHNVRIHCCAAILVVAAGFLLGISAGEWIAVVFAIGLVFTAEAINTSIERLADEVQPEWDEHIRDVKDLAAGAVLFAAIAALVVGLIIFVPKIIALF